MEGEEGSANNHQNLQLKRQTNIKPILRDILVCKHNGTTYRGDTKLKGNVGRRATLEVDSIEAQIIANFIETGMSQRRALSMLNHHRNELNQPLVSYTAVNTLIKQMKPLI